MSGSRRFPGEDRKGGSKRHHHQKNSDYPVHPCSLPKPNSKSPETQSCLKTALSLFLIVRAMNPHTRSGPRRRPILPAFIRIIYLVVMVIMSRSLHGRTVNLDFDDAQADIEVFQEITSNTTLDVNAQPRTEIDTGIWMELALSDSSGSPASGHVNNSGLGVIGDPGANQLSAGEVILITFFDAATGGTPISITLDRITFGNFGGTAAAAAGDAVQVDASTLPLINLTGNTGATGTGWTYTQQDPTAANGTGRLDFNPAISVPSITLKDQSTGVGGSRFQRFDFSGTGTPPDPDPSAPNIVFIIVDDMGYSDIGCYGGEIDTPRIDSLADEGLRFRQFYNNAKCETTRSCLMSGLYHGRSGLQVQNGATLAEAARSGGYRTYASGKWHLGEDDTGRDPTHRGFHHFYGLYDGASSYFPSDINNNKVSLDTQETNNFISPYPLSNFTPSGSSPGNLSKQTGFPAGYYMTDAIGDHAVSFINDSHSNHPDRPFFLYLSFNAPHTPLQAPVALINKYRNTYKAKGWDVLREEKWERQVASGIVDPKWQLPDYREDIPRWDDLDPTAQDLEDHRRSVYAAMIDSVDQNIGKVLGLLDTLSIADDTLVIFCSDNGAQAFDNASAAQRMVNPDDPDSKWNPGAAWAAYSNAPFRYHKQAQHQGGICAPLVVRWPGVVAPGEITDEPAHVVDIMATMVDVGVLDYDSLTTTTGAAAPPMDGASLLPIFNGTGRPAPDFWGFEFGRKDFAVIQGDWKLVSFRSSPWRLYNLADDRTETRNLVRKFPAKAQAMALLYDQWANDSYGNSSRTYANREPIPDLGDQYMRYEIVDTGALYSDPPVGCTVSDIGTTPASAVSEKHEVWTVLSSGPQIGGTADAFNLTSLPFFGDGEIVVRIESIANATASGLAGIMMRESTASDSRFVMTGINPAGTCSQLLRDTAGGTATSTGSATFSTPAFLRLERSGNTFTSSASSDGLAWTTLATQNVALGAELIAGLASASGSSSNQATMVYREWEYRDIGQYPEQCRLVDGFPQALAYAYGADPETPAYDRHPTIQLAKDGSSSFPQLRIHQRLNLTGLSLHIEESATLSPWTTLPSTWTEVFSSPLPDGISQVIELRRDTAIADEAQRFYRLRVDKH